MYMYSFFKKEFCSYSYYCLETGFQVAQAASNSLCSWRWLWISDTSSKCKYYSTLYAVALCKLTDWVTFPVLYYFFEKGSCCLALPSQTQGTPPWPLGCYDYKCILSYLWVYMKNKTTLLKSTWNQFGLRYLKLLYFWTGEMAQWLRALAVFPRDLGSILSNHMVAHNCNYRSRR